MSLALHNAIEALLAAAFHLSYGKVIERLMGKQKKPMSKLKRQSGRQVDRSARPAFAASWWIHPCHGQEKLKHRVVSNFNRIPSILLSLSEAVILSSKK